MTDILVRGAGAGMSLLVAAAFISKFSLNWRRILGASLAVSTGAYILVSLPALNGALEPVMPALIVLAMFGPIAFWWFFLTLFDDNFVWRWPLFIPLAARIIFLAAYYLAEPTSLFSAISFVIWRAVILFMYGHAIFTALRYAQDDLIEGRRRFRVIFAILVSIVGLAIVYVETTNADLVLTPQLSLVHATIITLITLGFGAWLLAARNEVLDGLQRGEAEAANTRSFVPAADQTAYEKLTALMREEIWRQEGLSVSLLAEKVEVPEHQLRKLINGVLGFRNFSAYLNEYRIDAAKTALADPAQARRQILQLAHELGYASITPFNRAFKEATGLTPSEFRKKSLNEG
ncbi:AraC family transcriptional regulator [Hyphococcus flavus]|uniref:AraC family transcriptional regulator n=1 Tax=Hyphococcus flavus TaxID=1866326 RepID=A0AAE9ZHQ1_9PROT|nr:AraC family transcriptional regulator [Hyphococcus flavus]WDI30420.1 AraC family transcriptional regulator [Hyphococcus flavus]